MVDLKAKPFYLDEAGVEWVEKTIASMSVEEKIGQLFIQLFMEPDLESAKQVLKKYHIGGVRYHGAHSSHVYELTSMLQTES